jgi:hypothetical protein
LQLNLEIDGWLSYYWNADCLLENCGCSAKAMGEALSSSSSRDRQAKGSGDPLIEPLAFYIVINKMRRHL